MQSRAFLVFFKYSLKDISNISPPTIKKIPTIDIYATIVLYGQYLFCNLFAVLSMMFVLYVMMILLPSVQFAERGRVRCIQYTVLGTVGAVLFRLSIWLLKQCILYYLHCTMSSSEYTLYYLHDTMIYLQYKLHYLHCKIYSSEYIFHYLHCTLCYFQYSCVRGQ